LVRLSGLKSFLEQEALQANGQAGEVQSQFLSPLPSSVLMESYVSAVVVS
jgi:hypothetical protein